MLNIDTSFLNTPSSTSQRSHNRAKFVTLDRSVRPWRDPRDARSSTFASHARVRARVNRLDHPSVPSSSLPLASSFSLSYRISINTKYCSVGFFFFFFSNIAIEHFYDIGDIFVNLCRAIREMKIVKITEPARSFGLLHQMIERGYATFDTFEKSSCREIGES